MDASDNSFLDTKYEYTLLFDFYGALLKDKNYSMFEDYVCNDMSLSEIAAEQGITRQGVRDTIKRSLNKLIEYEDKLGLIKRFDTAKKSVSVIKEQVMELRNDIISEHSGIEEHLNVIDSMADSILEEL